jgi:3-oxoacyl-[acyl-carrier-protein] synthase II
VRNRVVVTGMGVVSSAGTGCETFRSAVVAGKQSFSAINRPHLSHLRATHAGLINGFDESRIELKTGQCPLDLFAYFAESAGREALFRAGIKPLDLGHRIGLVFATCSGPMQTIERHYGRILSGDESLSAEELFAKRYYSGAKALAHVFGIRGVNTTVVTACSASLAAIGLGADLIRLGTADVVLAGGSDTFSETTCAGFDGLRATCNGLCAPFSKPSGLNLGEAAAFVVLENLDHLRQRRQAQAYAEILGFGLSNDAYHCTAPEPSGAGQVLAMERALSDAGVDPLTITYINAHGTGTDANDKTETRAIKKVFGGRAQSIPVSSVKSMVGHCLGAAGALETVAGILCLQKGVYPPTANFSEAREGCNLDYIPEAGRRIPADGLMMKNNFAFGGNNASLVLASRAQPAYVPPQNTTDEAIVITGIGLVSAAGIGHERFCSAISSGKDLLSEIPVCGRARCRAGIVPQFELRAIDRRLDDRAMDRSSRFATAATCIALANAAYPEKQAIRRDLGLFLHLSAGPSWAESEHIGSLIREKFHISQVNAFPYIVPNSVAGIVCKSLHISGYNSTLCFGPGAGLMGLLFSVNALRNGHANSLVHCAVDELSQRIAADLFMAGRISDTQPPYGEGACTFLLETESHALSRNAKILGRICACSHSTETSRCNGPDDDTELLKSTVKRALEEANVAPSDIGTVCCNSHNRRETSVIEDVLGRRDPIYIDCASKTGFAEATLPLYNMSYVLLDQSFEKGPSNKYILVVFSSDHGINCATVIRKE